MTVDKKDTSVGVVNENETVVSENSDEIITEALEEENKKRKKHNLKWALIWTGGWLFSFVVGGLFSYRTLSLTINFIGVIYGFFFFVLGTVRIWRKDKKIWVKIIHTLLWAILALVLAVISNAGGMVIIRV